MRLIYESWLAVPECFQSRAQCQRALLTFSASILTRLLSTLCGSPSHPFEAFIRSSCSTAQTIPRLLISLSTKAKLLLVVCRAWFGLLPAPRGSLWPSPVPFPPHPTHCAPAPLAYLLLEHAKLVPTSGLLHILILHLPSSRYFYNCLPVIIQDVSPLSLPQRGHPDRLLQPVIISSTLLLTWPHCTCQSVSYKLFLPLFFNVLKIIEM